MQVSIKMRGKRQTGKRKRSEQLEKPPKKILSSKRRTRSKTASDHNLSQLELLPLEILQDVFNYSANLRLPLLSRALYTKLGSIQSKNRLVQHYFGGGSSFVGQQCSDKEWGKVQSSILSQKWFDYPYFYDRMVETTLSRFISIIVKFHELSRYEVQRKEVESFRVWFQEFSPCLFDRLDYPGPDVEWETTEPQSGSTLKVTFGPPPFRFNIVRRTADQEQGHETSYEWNKPWPDLDEYCNIPSKLLRGPWTQSKGSFLMALTFRSCEVKESHSVIAEEGLMEAIQEDCHPAIKLLISGPSTLAQISSFGSSERIEGKAMDSDSEPWRYLPPILQMVPWTPPTPGQFSPTYEQRGPSCLRTPVRSRHLNGSLMRAADMNDTEQAAFKFIFTFVGFNGQLDRPAFLSWLKTQMIREKSAGCEERLQVYNRAWDYAINAIVDS